MKKVILLYVVGLAIVAGIPVLTGHLVATPEARELIGQGVAMFLAGCVVFGFISKR
ncbi:hypothetical protein [Cupriavidus pauculus]|uniref:hypothetical protein n=1 Tax=Cupriavidus pauculus TaxID=82633 RepID=UPI003857B16C